MARVINTLIPMMLLVLLEKWSWSSSSSAPSWVSGESVLSFTSEFTGHWHLMMNPERGAYTSTIYLTSRWSSFAKAAPTIHDAMTRYHNTLWMMEIVLDDYTNTSTLSPQLLHNIQTEINLYKNMRQKLLIRFSYNYYTPDDASPSIVYSHIQQLSPLLTQNQDSIFIVQAGFIGTYGEWAFSTGFPCTDGACGADQYVARKKVVTMLMDAVPKRYVQIRYPFWVEWMFSNPTPPTSPNLNSYIGRIAFHDDCYVSDSLVKGESGNFINVSDIPYEEKWTRYTPFVVETCHVNEPWSDCPYTLKTSAALHVTSVHTDYNKNVWANWGSEGCYKSMMLRMGYRLQLLSTKGDLTTVAGGIFRLRFQVKNVGFAAPASPRFTEIVLRSIDAAQTVCVARLNTVDPRYWLSDSTWSYDVVIRLPETMSDNTYEVLLQLADTFPTMYTTPWNKIGFATNNVFESGTGFNKMGQTIRVTSIGSVADTLDGEVQAQCGLTVGNLVSFTDITTPMNTCLQGYYMNKNTSVCTWCPIGTYCSTSASQPVACPIGFWSAGGQSACNMCATSCNGVGTCMVNSGACLCEAAYTGPDCSVSVSSLPPPTITSTISSAFRRLLRLRQYVMQKSLL